MNFKLIKSYLLLVVFSFLCPFVVMGQTNANDWIAKIKKGDPAIAFKDTDGKIIHPFQKDQYGDNYFYANSVKELPEFVGTASAYLIEGAWSTGAHEVADGFIVTLPSNATGPVRVLARGTFQQVNGSTRNFESIQHVWIEADAECCPSIELVQKLEWKNGQMKEGPISVRAAKSSFSKNRPPSAISGIYSVNYEGFNGKLELLSDGPLLSMGQA